MKVTFDMTITLGNILQAGAMLLAVFASYVRLSNRLAVLEMRVDALWRVFMHDRAGV